MKYGFTKKNPGHQTVIPYIRIENPIGFIKWTSDVFGAKEKEVVKSDDGTVRHAQILIDDAIIMMSTARAEWPVDNATFYIYVKSVEESYAKAITHGADSVRGWASVQKSFIDDSANVSKSVSVLLSTSK